MIHTHSPLLPQETRRLFHIQPARRVNRRRRRWPARLLFFTLGLLAGWLLREGGACLP